MGLANANAPQLPGGGEGRAQLELTDALDTMLFYIAMES